MLDHIHDNFFKQVFSDIQNVRDFLSLALPDDIVPHIDLDTLKIDPTTYISKDIKGYFCDIVVQTQLKDTHTPTDIYLLMEHKSYHDKGVLLQLLHYMLLMWQKDQQAGKSLRMVLPLVFYHGKQTWRVPDEFKAQFDVPDAFQKYLLNFRYLLFDTQKQALETEPRWKQNIFLLSALVLMKSLHHKDLESIQWVLDLWAEAGFFNEQDILFLYTYIVRTRDEDKIETLLKENERNSLMATIAERWMQEGIEKGIEKGEKENSRKVALQMKKDGMDTALITKYTGLSKEEIESLD